MRCVRGVRGCCSVAAACSAGKRRPQMVASFPAAVEAWAPARVRAKWRAGRAGDAAEAAVRRGAGRGRTRVPPRRVRARHHAAVLQAEEPN